MENGIPWLAGMMSIVVIAAAAKGCNESDNALYTKVAQAGCSVVYLPGSGREVLCPGFERSTGFKPTPTEPTP